MQTPQISPVNGPLKSGATVYVSGTTLPSVTRFSINLQCGASFFPRDGVALHFSPDFVRNCVIRNSMLNGNWGPEECEGPFPFARGVPFKVVIVCQEDCFKILVDGRELTRFEHRVPYGRVTHVSIDGDVLVESVTSSNGTPASYGFSINEPPAANPPPYWGNPPPYPTGNAQPYPAAPSSAPPVPGGVYYPVAPGYPPTAGYPTLGSGAPPYPAQPPYTAPGSGSTYPVQASYPGPAAASAYPAQGQPSPQSGYNSQSHQSHVYPGAPPGAPPPHFNSHSSGHKGGLMDKAGTVLTGAMGAGLLGSVLGKKGLKSQKKAQKKALKYGIPIAGVGLGAYALKKGFGGFGSSSSSDSD